jgi:nitric oxide reductase subunit C
MIRWPSVLALILVGLGAACATAGGPADEPTTASPPANDKQLVAAGLEVYRQQYCGVCHQLDTAGTAGVFGPPHNGLGTTAEHRVADPGYTGSATTAEEYIRESIRDPKRYIVPGYENARAQMPAYTNLSEQEVDALVHLLLEEK